MQPLSSLQTVLNCEVFNDNICSFINLASQILRIFTETEVRHISTSGLIDLLT